MPDFYFGDKRPLVNLSGTINELPSNSHLLGSAIDIDTLSAQTTINSTDQFILQETNQGSIKKTTWSTIRTTACGNVWPQGDGQVRIGDGATNYLNVAADGTVTLKGTATYFKDELGRLSTAKIMTPGNKIVMDDAEGAYYYKDSATTDDYLWTNIQFNHHRMHGQAFSPHLHWWQASANIPNWLLQYRYQKQGASKTASWTSAKWISHVFTYTSGTLCQITEFADITPPAGDGISDMLQVRIIRDTANASTLFSGTDPLTGDVYIVDFDCHLECDALGSSVEYTK